MKRLIAAVLCIGMVFSLASCGSSSSKSDASSKSSSSSASSSASGSESKSDGSSSGEADYSKYGFTKGEVVRITNDENSEPVVPELTFEGLILSGNRQDNNRFDTLEKNGYKMTGLCADFWLDEHIEIHAKLNVTGTYNDFKAVCVPHKDIKTYLTSSFSDMTSEAESSGAVIEITEPDAEQQNQIADFYVGPADEKKPGSYDILFYYKDKLAYYLPIELTVEPQ